MASFIVKQTATSAPVIADGVQLLRFDGMRETFHESWVGKPNKFNDRLDTGERWALDFTVFDQETGTVVYDSREDKQGEELAFYEEVNRTISENSNTYKFLSGILTEAELDALTSGAEFDLAVSFGRFVQGVIKHSDKGWPKLASVFPITAPQRALLKKSGAM